MHPKWSEVEGVPQYIRGVDVEAVATEQAEPYDAELWHCEETRKVRVFREQKFVLSFNPEEVSHIRVQEFLRQQGLPGAALAVAECMKQIRIRLV